MTNTDTAAYWIHHLGLLPHPEGGFYTETFRSGTSVNRTGGTMVKQACTSIHYLLEGADYSGFHRIGSDEIWYFHKGAPLHIHAIDKDGKYIVHELSDRPSGNLSVVIPAGQWFAAELPGKEHYALVSCAVAPGFDFAEFEMAVTGPLSDQYPQHKAIIGRLCRL
ncbi:cupin domain-containing protein [Mucilaginibacter myungsuensis]|uniref:Cupin domain-containing protein n=1 Tax=Mucilaginibacter myungsuensis TaxID=649104 RepID=A0A929PX16_9SPHI|nr:cupin domain-containing protein [Mucilaginibacter myungsuensis]MBE9662691.1 cupin domain-containing protein [Mucilaginibacter myungsuensis]MDN3598111.1 cupin domain-containing protein [Mucilaginibacter myungsuensis]